MNESIGSPPASILGASTGSTPAPSEAPLPNDYVHMLQYALLTPSRKPQQTQQQQQQEQQKPRVAEVAVGFSPASSGADYPPPPPRPRTAPFRDGHKDYVAQYFAEREAARKTESMATSAAAPTSKALAAMEAATAAATTTTTIAPNVSATANAPEVTLDDLHAPPPPPHNSVTAPPASGGGVPVAAAMDESMGQLENSLEACFSQLKREVLGDYVTSKMRLLEQSRARVVAEQAEGEKRLEEAQAEMARLQELLSTYETNLTKKDGIIENLTSALAAEKNKVSMQRQFCKWQLAKGDASREAFVSAMATRYARRQAIFRAFRGWRGQVVNRWRARVTEACQVRAEEVCLELRAQHREKEAELETQLAEAARENSRLQARRQEYEEQMKKAFMRGVCALNMEAMSMFSDAPENMERRANVAMGSTTAAAEVAPGLAAELGPGEHVAGNSVSPPPMPFRAAPQPHPQPSLLGTVSVAPSPRPVDLSVPRPVWGTPKQQQQQQVGTRMPVSRASNGSRIVRVEKHSTPTPTVRIVP